MEGDTEAVAVADTEGEGEVEGMNTEVTSSDNTLTTRLGSMEFKAELKLVSMTDVLLASESTRDWKSSNEDTCTTTM